MSIPNFVKIVQPFKILKRQTKWHAPTNRMVKIVIFWDIMCNLTGANVPEEHGACIFWFDPTNFNSEHRGWVLLQNVDACLPKYMASDSIRQ
jgi:hypothetical protein